MWLLKTTSVMLVITLTLPGVCESNWKVTLSNLQLCALNGSSVVFGCTYDYPSDQTITNTFWYFWCQGKNNDLLMSKEYTERSIYLGNKEHNCTLRINNLVSSDATTYCFRFETINTNKKPNAWSSKTSVTLTLTGLTAVVNPATVREGEKVTLTCSTTCTLSDHPTIVWFRDGHSVPNKEFQASIEDAGRYRCAVQGQDHLTSAPVSLDVQYAPKNVTLSVSPCGDVVKGISVNLTCNCSANSPVMSYTLYKESGQSLVTLVPWQNHIMVFHYSVIITDAPKNTSVLISSYGPVVEGSSVNLTCSTDANPTVEYYTWFKKDGAYTSQIGSGEVLRLTSLTSSDSGQYFCEARNEEGVQNSTVMYLTIQGANHAKNTVLMPVYIGSVAAVFMVIIPLWMCKSQFKLCQKTAVDKKDDQNPVLSSRRTRNDPATQETRTEEQENALYANVQLPPSHTHHQDSSLCSVVQPPPPLNPPDLHYASFDFQQSHNSIDGVQLSGPHGRDDVVYSTVKSRQANVTDNLQYASIKFPLSSPTARPEESLEVDHSVIYSTVAKSEA